MIDTCSQIKGTSACSNPAAFRMFWPGTAPKPICAECAEKAQRISGAMGFYLHLEPVEEGKDRQGLPGTWISAESSPV